MGCCLLVLASWISPRFVLFLMWIFGDRLDFVFDSFITGFAGFLLLPWTTLAYAKERVQFGKPIGEYQLIQEKLALMEVARLNVENLVFRHLEMSAAGDALTLAEASAMKLYSARAAVEVALEAVQLFGGNGYMSEFRVEQLARDAKVLQIYAGTDEIQITHIAKALLAG